MDLLLLRPGHIPETIDGRVSWLDEPFSLNLAVGVVSEARREPVESGEQGEVVCLRGTKSRTGKAALEG